MSKVHLSIIGMAALALFGMTGCAVQPGDESDEEEAQGEEEVGEDQAALGCYNLGGYDGQCTEEWDPNYPTGEGGDYCQECTYLSYKKGYYIVCTNSGGPVTFDPCTP